MLSYVTENSTSAAPSPYHWLKRHSQTAADRLPNTPVVQTMPATTPLFSDLVRDPSEIRSAAISLGEHLGEYELFYELIRFLPTATTAQFIDHLREVADIEDLI